MAKPQKNPDSLFFLMGILIAIVLILFSPSLTSGFAYDSNAQILTGDFIHQRTNLIPVLTFQVMSWDVLDFNRPVQLASLMFDSLVWGKNPFGYHLTNLLLHAIATCLTFLLIRHILAFTNPTRDNSRQNFSTFLATLLFLVHPLVTEAVCEPSNRKDILAAVFGFTALLVLTRHSPAIRHGDALRLLLGIFLSLLSIGTKEVGVAIPVIIFLYWFLFRRQEPRTFWIIAIMGSAAVNIAFLIARFALAHQPSEIFLNPPSYPGGSLTTALLFQPRILVLYLINTLWPTNLCANYNLYSLRFLPLIPSLFVLAAFGALLAWWSSKDRRALFGTGIIAAALLPVCNLVPIYRPIADRYLYLPLIGMALLLAIGLDRPWLTKKSSRYRIAIILILIIASLLTQTTLQRQWAWSSQLTLWQDTLERNPRSYDALVNLPECLLDAGRLEESKTQYEYTLRTPYANHPWTWAGYAILLNRLGDRAHAELAAKRALALKPDIIDVDKMVRTMQTDRNFAEEFAPLARLSQRPPASPITTSKPTAKSPGK